LDWRENAAKAVVVITDAPPHGLPESNGDGFPNGCPCGRHWYTQASCLREMGISCYTVGCGVSGMSETVLKTIAHVSRGVYVTMNDTKLLVSLIVGAAEMEIDRQRIAEVVLEEIETRKDELKAILSPASNNNNNNNDNESSSSEEREDKLVKSLLESLKHKEIKVRVLQSDGIKFVSIEYDHVVLALQSLRRTNRIDF